MYASHICRGLSKWIEDKESWGHFHSVFKSSLNILSEDGRLISVVISDKPMSPNSIKLEEGFNFDNLNIRIGEKGSFTKDSFTSKNMNISFEQSTLWDSRVNLIPNTGTHSNLQEKLDITKEFILDKGNKNGIFGLMKFIQDDFHDFAGEEIMDQSQLFIRQRFIDFVDSYGNYDIESIGSLAKKIIGFGPGLTPSMDDFLSGLMIANIYITYFLKGDMDRAYLLNQMIVKDIENMTTLVSESMLKMSSIGETNEDIRNLMIALSGNSSKDQLKDLLHRVINFGHSSGTDILCGIYIGSCILLKRLLYFKK